MTDKVTIDIEIEIKDKGAIKPKDDVEDIETENDIIKGEIETEEDYAAAVPTKKPKYRIMSGTPEPDDDTDDDTYHDSDDTDDKPPKKPKKIKESDDDDKSDPPPDDNPSDRTEKNEAESPISKDEVPTERTQGFGSLYGIGHTRKRRYKFQRDRRKTPETEGSAPFDASRDQEFGGQSIYEPERGFAESKVNRRGNVNRSGVIGPALPTVEEIQDAKKRAIREILSWEEKLQKQQQTEQRKTENTQRRESVDAVKSVTSPISQGVSAIQNPVGAFSEHLLVTLAGSGPHGAAVVAAIVAIITAPKTIEVLIKTLGQKGLFLNADFKRLIEEEVNALFDLEEKRRRLLGQDAFIVTSQDRYEPESGSVTFNSLANRDEILISKKIGENEKAFGVTY